MIRRSPSPTRNYTALHNSVLADNNLSWEARGLLAYLLSKPDNWSVLPKHLMKESPNARQAKVYRILEELKSAGYIVGKRVRNAVGQLGAMEYVVYDTPQEQEAESSGDFTTSEFSTSGLPTSGLPKSGKPRRIIKTDSNQILNVKTTEENNLVRSAEAEAHDGEETVVETKPRRVAYSAEYEILWKAFPRRVNKSAGWHAVSARLREGVSYADLLLATQTYALARLGQEPRYTLHPQTFFGPARRYEEYLPGEVGYEEAHRNDAQGRAVPKAFSGIAAFLEGNDE